MNLVVNSRGSFFILWCAEFVGLGGTPGSSEHIIYGGPLLFSYLLLDKESLHVCGTYLVTDRTLIGTYAC
jgi:hypothetical protein